LGVSLTCCVGRFWACVQQLRGFRA
jgi:hypothetical protein